MGNSIICKPVHNIKFSSYSISALERMGDQLSSAEIASILLVSSTFHGIFTRTSTTLQVAVNVSMTDWEGIAKVSKDWPNTVQQIIARDARMMEVNTSGQESIFWGELSRCLKGY